MFEIKAGFCENSFTILDIAELSCNREKSGTFFAMGITIVNRAYTLFSCPHFVPLLHRALTPCSHLVDRCVHPCVALLCVCVFIFVEFSVYVIFAALIDLDRVEIGLITTLFCSSQYFALSMSLLGDRDHSSIREPCSCCSLQLCSFILKGTVCVSAIACVRTCRSHLKIYSFSILELSPFIYI